MRIVSSQTAVLTAALLAGCTLGPNFKPPEPSPVQSYTAPGDAAAPADQHVTLGARIEGDWWAQFHSPALDSVIKLAIADNQDIAVAKARLAAAQEEVKQAEGATLPQVNLNGVAGRQKYGAALFGPLNFTIPPFTYYTVGPTVSFPLDIFGGRKRTVEAQQAYAQYQSYELAAAYLSLTANIAAQAVMTASADAQIEVIQAIVADDQRNIELVQKALDAGSATRTQLLAAQSQFASDQTYLPALKQQSVTARHALAILAGKAPSEWTPPAFKLADFVLPAEIPASLPSELAHRRPDILAAEAQLHVASAAIGVATANLYPKVDLVGTATQQTLTPGGLFNASAFAWSVAANVTQPLFDGGQLSAKKREAIDNYQGALASYRKVLLESFGEVADNIQAIVNDADQLHAEAAAANTAVSARDLARRSFEVGNSGILDVIDVERRAAEAQLGVSRATAQRLLDSAKLYVALGGTVIAAEEAKADAKAGN